MRVTKAMKDYVEENLNEKRLKKDKEFSAAYKERKKKACEEIEALLPDLYKKIENILIKYNMDIECKRDSSNNAMPEKIVQGVYDAYIQNYEESSKIREFERDNYKKQQEMMKRFILECDLGIEKEEFFKKVEEMSF